MQTLALQSDGKLLIGGGFSTVGGISRQGIARLNTNGTLDLTFSNAFNVNATLYSLAVLPSGQILVGGQFNSVDGVTRSNLVRLNVDGSVDATWGATNMVNGYVQSISVQSDNQILIGGGFTTVRGITKRQVARFHEDGTVDTAFDVGNGPNFNPSVQVVRALADGQVMVGGTFTSFNSVSRPYLVRLSNLGAVDSSFNATISGSNIMDVREQSDGKLLVGGTFTLFHNGNNVSAFMRYLTNGVADTNFVTGTGVQFNATVQTIVPQSDGKIIIGGSFSSYNATAKAFVARILGDGPVAPLVTITPSSVTAAVGDNVFLAAVATGLNQLRFQWRKEGTNIVGQTNTFLSLPNVQTNAAGNYTVVVSNSVGVVTSAVATITFQAGSLFDTWAAANGLTPGNDDPDQDPDNDGVDNVFEFYLGTSPTNSASANEPVATSVSSGGQTYPAITFIRVKNISGVTLLPQASSDVNFSNSLGTVVESVIDLGDGSELVTIRSAVNATSQPTQFLRIQLSIP